MKSEVRSLKSETAGWSAAVPGRCNVVLGLLFIVLNCATVFAADVTGAFDQASRFYEEGKFRDAAAAYSGIVAGGSSSPALFFNLGNAQFKSGHVGEAILSYRQAEGLAPRDPDLRANLEFARKRVSGPSLHPSWISRQITALTLNEWTILAVVPVWLWFSLMIAGQFKPALKRTLHGARLLTGSMALTTGGLLAFVLTQRLSEHTVVVTARDTVVRYGPFDESPGAFTAADGAELTLLDAKNDWFRVSDGEKADGWLKTNAVVVVRQPI